MPFGLKSPSIVFQRVINTLFSDMLSNDVYALLDDLFMVEAQKPIWLI